MAQVFEELVRPFQSPQTAPGQANVSQFSMNSQEPVILVVGSPNAASSSKSNAAGVGSSKISRTITFYLPQAAVEQTTA